MRRLHLVVVGLMAVLAVVGAFLVARGAAWTLVALPVCVCAIGLAAYVVGTPVGERPVRTPVVATLLIALVLGVVLCVVALVTGDTPARVFTSLTLLGTVGAGAGALVHLRRSASTRAR